MIRRYFKIELYLFTKNFFRKTFAQYVTVWLVRMWTHKYADKKAHSFLRRSKKIKKKADEERILRKSTLIYELFPKSFSREKQNFSLAFLSFCIESRI